MGPVPQLLLVSAVAYLVGGLPFGYWFVRLTSGKDIRTMGSGNIGATNVHRTQGGKAGVIVLLLDILKGFIAVFIGALVAPNNATALGLSAVFVMLGHCYPVFLRFKGGKAVACFVCAFLYIAPVALGIVLLMFVGIMEIHIAGLYCRGADFPVSILDHLPAGNRFIGRLYLLQLANHVPAQGKYRTAAKREGERFLA